MTDSETAAFRCSMDVHWPSAIRYGHQDRILKDHTRLGWRVLANLNLVRDREKSDFPSRAGITHYIAVQRERSRSKRRRGGWARLRGGSGWWRGHAVLAMRATES
eukprot:4052223-Pleurochrysis_carterae.AAC.1